MVLSNFKSVLLNRFLHYVSFDTQSSEKSDSVPSTQSQFVLANVIAEELKNIGVDNVMVDSKSYVYASISANTEKILPKIGFISHLDTSPEMSGKNVNPMVIYNYQLNNILLNEDKNIVLSPDDYSDLKTLYGQTIICTDGTTLLGADDKAGLAEIVTAIEFLIKNPQIEHGKICIVFTPDEEIGAGIDNFNLDNFDVDFAYTVDGGELGELEYENFNAASAKINISGNNTHPGTAKNKMINAALVASEFVSMLPAKERPETTEYYEGFFHLCDFTACVETAELNYIIRDFDKDNFLKRKHFILLTAEKLNKIYGKNLVSVEIKDQYFNMKEIIEQNFHVVELAKNAMIKSGVKPLIKPIRGGTDGVRLSFLGVPCPNLFTGGYNFHGKYEFAVLESMLKSVEVILNIIKN